MRRNGFGEARDPILKPLDTIECRDAILAPDGTEQEWPPADVVIGNPPFLGNLLVTTFGEEYVSQLFATYRGQVPAKADLVCYWFQRAGQYLESGNARRVGLVATNSIRAVRAGEYCKLQPRADPSSTRGATSRGSTTAPPSECR